MKQSGTSTTLQAGTGNRCIAEIQVAWKIYAVDEKVLSTSIIVGAAQAWTYSAGWLRASDQYSGLAASPPGAIPSWTQLRPHPYLILATASPGSGAFFQVARAAVAPALRRRPSARIWRRESSNNQQQTSPTTAVCV